MNRIIVVIVAVVFNFSVGWVIAHAEENNPFTATLTSRVWSKYVVSAGLNLHNKPVLQTDLYVQHSSGLYCDIWWSVGLDGTSPNSDFGDEIDYTCGWTGKAGGLVLNFGVAYFDVHRLFGRPADDVVQIFGEVNHTFPVGVHSVTPFLRFEYSMVPPGSASDLKPTIEAHVGATFAINLNEKIALAIRPAFMYNSGGLVGDPISLFHPAVSFQVKLSGKVTLEVINLKFPVPLTHTSDDRKFAFVGGIGIVVTF